MTPERWENHTVGDLCRFTNGNGFKPPDWSNRGLPIIRIQNLNGSKEFNYFAGVPEKRWIVKPGDLLFAWAGTRGVSFGPTIWKGPKGVLNQHIYRITPKDGVDKLWLYYALKLVTSRIESKAHGFKSTLVHVHKSEILKQGVCLPPVSEQIKIGEILITWARAIEIIEDLVTLKLRLKRSLVHELIKGNKRFQEFHNRDWQQCSFDDLLKESFIAGSNGKTAKKLTVKLYGKGVVEKRDVRQGSEGTKYYVRRAGQFIYSKLDFLNGAFGIVPSELDGYESTLDLPAFDLRDDINPLWLLNYVLRPEFYKRFVQSAEGGRKARRVHPAELLQTVVSLPTLEEQNRVASVFATCDKEIEFLKKQLTAVRQQERALIVRLLAGDKSERTT